MPKKAEKHATDTFEKYKKSFLEDITNDLDSTEKGKRFALKMLDYWIGCPDSAEEDIVYCDGPNDGGIDLAYLEYGHDNSKEEGNDVEEGNTWYIIQSKYNTSFKGSATIWDEAYKIFNTLQGVKENLNKYSANVVKQVAAFLKESGAADKLVLVFFTQDSFSEEELCCLDGIREQGIKRFGEKFDVKNISIETIYNQNKEDSLSEKSYPFAANLISSSDDATLYIGSVGLIDLYVFMQTYNQRTNDLQLLYKKKCASVSRQN